jgi:TonB family protein
VGGPNGFQPPKPIKTADPEYPPEARDKHLPGKDNLIVLVNEDGFPEVLQVQKESNHIFDEAALRAVSQWRFKPATKDGKPVAVIIAVEMSLHFTN